MAEPWPGPPSWKVEDPGFLADLRWSFGVWKREPGLPLITLFIAALAALPADSPAAIVGFPAVLFTVGFLGTQRVWYQRAFRGKGLERAEIWKLTRRFFWRFVVLGIVVGIPLMTLFAATYRSSGVRIAVMYPAIFSVDILLTFITPALALSTRKVSRAFKIGIDALRTEWPRCAWYAVAPPLVAFIAGFDILRVTLGVVAAQIISLVAGELLNLWFKGAVVVYYLRRHPEVGDFGAAFSE